MAELTALQYRAFISYSHADTSWAKWLHRGLESFPIGKDLAGRETKTGTIPKSLRPVFRDRDDFTAGHSLTEQTLAALDASAALIALCSPAAAQSKYVTEEVRLFKARHPDRPVVPLIVDGTPGDPEDECFPKSLAFNLDADGAVTDQPVELLAADAREQGDGKTLALAKVVAGLLGVSPDDIFRRAERDRRRKARLRNGVIAVLALLAVAASGSAVYAWQQLKTNEAFLAATLERATGIVNTAVQQAETYGVPRGATLALLQQAEGLFDDMARLGRPTPELQLQKARMLIEFARNYEILGDTEKQRARAEEAHRITAALTSETTTESSKLSTLVGTLFEKGKVFEAQGNLTEALNAYESAIDICERQVAAKPDVSAWQRNLSLSYGRTASVLDDQGDLAGALERYNKALAIQLGLTETDPDNATWQRDVSVLEQRIGDVLLAQGDLDAALASYHDALAIVERFAEADPTNADWQRGLAVDYQKIGGVFEDQDNLTDALAAFRKSLAITEHLAGTDPSNAVWQRDLSVGYNKVGAVLKAQGDLDGALEAFRKSLIVTERLTTAGSSNAVWQHDLSVDYENIGDIAKSQDDLAAALVSYKKSLAIRERLVATDPSNAMWQFGLAIAHTKIGHVLGAQDKLDETLEAYRNALSIRAHLVEINPSNKTWRQDLAGTYEYIGDVFIAQERLPEALEAYQTVLAMAQDLAEDASPEDPDPQKTVALSYSKVGDLLRAQDDLAGARKAYQSGLEIWKRLSETGPDTMKAALAIAYDKLAAVLKAQDDIESALAAYRGSLAARKSLAETTPENTGAQNDLAIAYDRVGAILESQGDYPGALAAAQASLAISERLATADPDDEARQRALAWSYGEVARFLRARGDLDGALKQYESSLAIIQAIARTAPDDPWSLRGLSVTHELMGRILSKQGDADGAVAAFRQAIDSARKLIAKDSRNEKWRQDLADGVSGLGGMAYDYVLAHDYETALQVAEEAIGLDEGKIWFRSNQAHALMMLGREAEARAIYLKYRGLSAVQDNRSWDDIILTDFGEMREAGIGHPLMDEIERALQKPDTAPPEAAQAEPVR